MVGIGLFPFILLPWAFVGPIVWGIIAANHWQRNRLWSRVAGITAALSIVIPLSAAYDSWENGAAAAIVVAGISAAVFVIQALVRACRHLVRRLMDSQTLGQ